MHYQLSSQIIIAVATPPGIGAIGIIRLSGNGCIELVDAFFKGKKLSNQAANTLHFGYIINENKEVLDEVVASIFKAPKSYTKEDVVEISCHGSNFILEEIVQLFLNNGATLAAEGEFTFRAFRNGRFNLMQAEAVADLIDSDSQISRNLALNQLRGGFTKKIEELREQLIHFASMIELELDFSEEDVEFASREQLLILLNDCVKYLKPLIESYKVGNVIKKGVPVAIIGLPNMGKSTLLNALLQEEKAIVTHIAGTTRDVIEDEIIIDGIRFRFIDTAGIRDTEDEIEAIGVRKSLEKMRQAELVLFLYDSAESLQSSQVLFNEIKSQKNIDFIPLRTKIALSEIEKPLLENEIAISAKEGINLEILQKAIFDKTIGKSEQRNEMVTNLRHLKALEDTLGAIINAKKALETKISADLVAEDLRQALYYLGLLTGKITTDDLLSNIFSRFCIGK